MIKSRSELFALLDSVYPTRENGYTGSSSVPKMPYMNYYFTGSINGSADNRSYIKTGAFRVELYSETAQTLSAQRKLEKAFDDNEVYYESNRSPLHEFDAVMTTYEISLYIKESEE